MSVSRSNGRDPLPKKSASPRFRRSFRAARCDRRAATIGTVHYVVIGALGRVLHGTDERTDGLDIVPYVREENLQRLETALAELHARHPDGKPPQLERD